MTLREYEDIKFGLDLSLKNLDFGDMTKIWNNMYYDATLDGNVKHPIKCLVLIHPDYWITHSGESISLSDGKFLNQINQDTKCEWNRFGNYVCPWNRDIFLRGNLEIDHHWPASLGGPSLDSNRLNLCKHHNQMKSNSVEHYPWNTKPAWLGQG